jgi:hypothetical protein
MVAGGAIEEGCELADHRELTDVGQRRIGGQGHDHIPADARLPCAVDAAVGGYRRSPSAR